MWSGATSRCNRDFNGAAFTRTRRLPGEEVVCTVRIKLQRGRVHPNAEIPTRVGTSASPQPALTQEPLRPVGNSAT
jgi:hypothetical protein